MATSIDLEDERMVSYVPLLVLSEEVFFYLTPAPLLKGEGDFLPLPEKERLGMTEKQLF